LYQHFDRILSKKTNQIMNCIPAKVKAIHICTGSGKSVTELVLPVLKQMAGKEMRLRFNLHVSIDGLNHTLGLMYRHLVCKLTFAALSF
jgi:hypothetical protein